MIVTWLSLSFLHIPIRRPPMKARHVGLPECLIPLTSQTNGARDQARAAGASPTDFVISTSQLTRYSPLILHLCPVLAGGARAGSTRLCRERVNRACTWRSHINPDSALAQMHSAS